MKQVLLLFVLASLALLIAGCSGGGDEIVVTISPVLVSVEANHEQQFTAEVYGTLDDEIEWGIAEGADGGFIFDDGRYAAPATPGTYHVIARCVENPHVRATATVIVY